jgi:predicted membrane metal-binding protein
MYSDLKGSANIVVKKLIAPIVITVLLVAYLALYLVFTASFPMPATQKIIGLLIPLVLMGVSVFVLVERIKEVRSGEEDDLGQY